MGRLGQNLRGSSPSFCWRQKSHRDFCQDKKSYIVRRSKHPRCIVRSYGSVFEGKGREKHLESCREFRKLNLRKVGQADVFLLFTQLTQNHNLFFRRIDHTKSFCISDSKKEKNAKTAFYSLLIPYHHFYGFIKRFDNH